jgi:N-carbamoyl-L-amino-acid hydrolase
MKALCANAMIFVPCKDGISQNEIEDARLEHLEAGANVLLHAALGCGGGKSGSTPRSS